MDAAKPLNVTAAFVAGLKAALVAAGLAFPILVWRAEPDYSNQLVLQNRWSWMAIAAIIAFAARFLSHVYEQRPKAEKAEKPARTATRAKKAG